MNIGKTLGKFFGRSKKKDGDEESGFHETINIGDISSMGKIRETKGGMETDKKEIGPMGTGDYVNEKRPKYYTSGDEVRGKPLEAVKEPLLEDTKQSVKVKNDISSMRVGGNFKFENYSGIPSADEVKMRLLEADRAHKLWKLRRRFKLIGREPTEEILQMEIDVSGPHKWDTIISRPPVERYILMNEYIRKLAAKEAKESGHFGIVTSRTTEKQLSKLHKKLRLDFTLNSNGEPSNLPIGEDSSDEERFDEDLHEEMFKWKTMRVFQSTDISKISTNNNLIPLKPLKDEQHLEYVTPAPSVNILNELHKDETSESSYPDSNSSIYESESDQRSPSEPDLSCASESKQDYSASSPSNEQLLDDSNDDSDQEQIPRIIFNASNMIDRFRGKLKVESD